jgi:quercetin dioxygenase-like cupin family protein
MSGKAEQKSFTQADETRSFEKGDLRLIRIGGADIGMLTLQPGWRWSEHVKPLAGTELCEAPHFQYHVQGTLHVVMEDGTEFDARPGDVTALPQGHDAWVTGDEPVIVVDWFGASNYAKD